MNVDYRNSTDGNLHRNVTRVGGFPAKQPEVVSGAWIFGNTSVNGCDCVEYTCTSAGIAQLSVSEFLQTGADWAYGRWHFWMYKGDEANSTRVHYIDAGGGGIGGPGYYINLRGDEKFDMYETGVGSKMRTGVIGTNNAWMEIDITRDKLNSFTAYLDKVAMVADTGTNPFTDDTTTTSTHFALDFDAGDKIAIPTGYGQFKNGV